MSIPETHFNRCRLLTCLLAGALLALVGCSQSRSTDDVDRLFVLGIDGLSWEKIDALVAAGELPNFRRMMDEGARATARGHYPLQAPSLWTTLQTGKLPQQHRTVGELVTLPSGVRAPVPSSMRPIPTLWQMVGRFNDMVATVGFPGSWPAEKLNGFVVSNMVTETRWTRAAEVGFDRVAGYLDTFPSSLRSDLDPLIRDPDGITREEAARFFTLNEEEYAALYEQPLGSLFRRTNPYKDVALTHQADHTYIDIALHLSDTYNPRVTAVYLELVSAIQYSFWAFSRPDIFGTGPDLERRLGGAVDEAYRWADEQLGRFMERMTERSTLVVASEHGFSTEDVVTEEGTPPVPVPKPTENAVYLMMGNGVRRGADAGRIDLQDVTPTLLALLGLPAGADMDGDVVRGVFDEKWLEAHPVEYIESHGTAFDPADRYAEAPPEELGTSAPN